MEPKRYDIIDCLSNGEAIPAHMAENCSGRWLDSRDHALVQALAIASAAREAGMVDEHGRFRKVLGTLPITADGCVVGEGVVLYHPEEPYEASLPAECNSVFFDTEYAGAEGDAVGGWRDVRLCYSNHEAARSAAEAAKGGGDAGS